MSNGYLSEWERRKKEVEDALTPSLPLPAQGQEFTTEAGEKFIVLPNASIIKGGVGEVGHADLSDWKKWLFPALPLYKKGYEVAGGFYEASPFSPKFWQLTPEQKEKYTAGGFMLKTPIPSDIAYQVRTVARSGEPIENYPLEWQPHIKRLREGFAEPTPAREFMLEWVLPTVLGGMGAVGLSAEVTAAKTAAGAIKNPALRGLAKAGVKATEILIAPAGKTPKIKIPVIENRMPTIQETIETLPKLAIKNKTEPEQATVAWNVLTGEKAQDFARIDMDAVLAADSPFRVNLKTGLVENVIPKSPKYKPYIQDILEFPNRYKLTSAQRAEVDLITQKILPQQLEKELASGVKVRPIGLKEGQRYFPREVTALENEAKLVIKRGGGYRPGVKPASFRQRWYEEVLEGMKAGKTYSTDYRALTEARLRAGNKAIADKMLADYLKPYGKLPLERMPIEVRTQYMGATRQYVGIRNFQKVVNRALRGERIPEVTLQAQESRFPELGARLRIILKTEKGVIRQKSLRDLITNANNLESELQSSYQLAKRAATRAMVKARVPIVGKEGMINHAALQGRIFPIETSDPVNLLIRKFTSDNQILSTMAKLNAVGRMGQTTFDPGFVTIQGLLVLANNPKTWGQAFWQSLKTLKNPKFMARFNIDKQATRLLITTHGGAPFARTEFTEAARAGGWLAKIPKVGRGFERFGTFFESYIDAARTYLVEGKITNLTNKFKRPLTNAELTDIVVTTDHMVGISSLTRYGASRFQEQLASNALYAPRYFMSFVSLLGMAFRGGVGGDIAREALAKLAFAVPVFMSGVAFALGQEERVIPTKEKPIPVMFDPRSSEFMSAEIAGTHMGLGGIWIAAFRLLGSLIRTAQDNPKDFISIDPHENPLLRYFYGRASPVAGAVIDVATGHNYLGERLDTPLDYLREVVDKTFPFWIAGSITDVPRAGWQKGLAELWGLRAWEVQYRELAQDYANTHIKDMPPAMIMPDQQERFAKGELKYKDLNNEQRAWLLNTFADYAEAEEKRKEQIKRTGTDEQVGYAYTRDFLDKDYEINMRELANKFLSGDITVPAYTSAARDLRLIKNGAYQFWTIYQQYVPGSTYEETQKFIEENTKPEDKILEQYMELRGDVPLAPTEKDWGVWNKKIDAFLYKLDPNTKAYIERRKDDWINNLPEEAQKVERLIMECETVLDQYYGVPVGKLRLDYRTSTPDVDAKLLILGRVTTLKTQEAIPIVKQILDKYGITNYPMYIGRAMMEAGEGGETDWEKRKRQVEEALGIY